MVTARAGEIVLDSNRYKLQDPKRWQKQPVLRAARKTGRGDTTYSDYDLWNVRAWDTWHLGRGEEYFETDGRYHDSWNAETRIRGQITLGPHIYSTGTAAGLGYESGTGPPPLGPGGKALGQASGKYAWAESFAAPTGGYTADGAWFVMKTYGGPTEDVTVSLCEDDGADAPGTVLKSKVLTSSSFSGSFYWIEFDWTGTQALVAATTYWLVVSVDTLMGANTYYVIYYDVDAGYSGACSYSGADPWDWTDDSANADLWFRLDGTEGELNGKPLRFAFFNDNGTEKLFVGAGTKVYVWDATNNDWDDDSAGATETITDMIVWNDCLVVAQGITYTMRKKQSGSWGAFTDDEGGGKLGIGICPAGGDAGKVVLIKSGATSGTDFHKVRCIAAVADTWQDLKSVDGADTIVGDSSADITWIGQYQGSIWLGKEDGVYEVGKDGIAYNKFPFFTQKADWNFGGSCVWHRNELMLPAAYGLWSFDGKSLKNIGPGIGMKLTGAYKGTHTKPMMIPMMGILGPDSGETVGLPTNRQGHIADLLPTVNVLYAAMDAGSTDSRYSSVLLWTGRGWHEVVRGDAINKEIEALGYTPAGTIETEARLWYGYGKKVFYCILPDTTDDPYQWTGAKFESQGWVEFGWFNADLSAVDKDWRSVTVEAENIDDSQVVELYYKLDDDTSWTSLGIVDDGTSGTAISNNQATLSFGTDTYGKRIKLRVDLGTAGPANTPKVTGIILKYWTVPDPVYGWNFTLKLTELDRSWRTQQSDFKTTYEEKEPVTLVDPYGASHTVRLDNLAETIVASETGEPLGCLITVRAVEA